MRRTVKNTDELLQIVDEYDAVSFDIFDTLIMRKTLLPQDVFAIAEQKLAGQGCFCDFVLNRKRAILENTTANPNINEIYDHFAKISDLSVSECQVLMQLELELERKVLVSRRTVVEALKRIHNMGKPVFLITDMYLPADIIEEILAGLGVTDYDDLLVSCDYRTLKTENLFSVYRKKHPYNRYLHIGDNLTSDIECAEKNGIDTVYLPSALNAFREHDKKGLIPQANTVYKRNMLGFMLADLYNDPFALPKEREWHIQDVAMITMAPIVFCMVAKLKRIVEERHYGKILFAARDGYLLKKLYDEIKGENDPEAVYFYTSRRAVTNISCENEHQILWLANLPYSYEKEKILKNVFGLSDTEYNEKEEFNTNILNYKAEIMRISNERKENYRKYLHNIGVSGDTYLFVDLVSSGTCQMYIDRLIDGELAGYYLCKLKTDEQAKECLNYSSLYKPVPIGDETYSFYKLYYLFESVLTSGEPSLDCFDREGKPIFLAETRSAEEINQVESLQSSLAGYFREMWCLCDGMREPAELFADRLIEFWRENIRECKINVNLQDDWMGTQIVVNDI